MKEYLDLLADVHEQGRYKHDRTKVGCYSVFGRQIRFDLSKGFPMVTTKKLHLRSIIHELLWFLKGDTNIAYLTENGVRIWDEWAQPQDETIEMFYSDHERARLYGELLGVSTEEAIDKLNKAWAVHRQDVEARANATLHFTISDQLTHGHKLLDAAGIPRSHHKVIKAKGDLGPIYGEQWRSWKDIDGRTHDQITNAIELLRKDPASRRNVVSAWNVGQLDQMHLNPCHALFQFYAEELTMAERITLYIDKQYPAGMSAAQYNADHLLTLAKRYEMADIQAVAAARVTDSPALLDEVAQQRELINTILAEHKIPVHRLSCQLYQRSADIFLGVPFNIASYALLTHMVAHVVGMAPGDFVHTFGDLHVYSNHIDQIELQMTREPLPLPKLLLNPDVKDIFDFTIDDIKIVGYESHPAIKGDVAV